MGRAAGRNELSELLASTTLMAMSHGPNGMIIAVMLGVIGQALFFGDETQFTRIRDALVKIVESEEFQEEVRKVDEKMLSEIELPVV